MRCLCLVIAALVAVSSAQAQTVPPVSVEATAGFGGHTGRTGRTYYNGDPVALVRVAATIRLAPEGAVRPVLIVEHAPSCTMGLCGDITDCPVAPNGSCYRPFEMPSGNAVALGVSANWRNEVTGTLSVGTAWYQRRASYIDATAVLPMWSHVGLVAGVRRIATNDYLGDRTWLLPISAGFRVY